MDCISSQISSIIDSGNPSERGWNKPVTKSFFFFFEHQSYANFTRCKRNFQAGHNALIGEKKRRENNTGRRGGVRRTRNMRADKCRFVQGFFFRLQKLWWVFCMIRRMALGSQQVLQNYGDSGGRQFPGSSIARCSRWKFLVYPTTLNTDFVSSYRVRKVFVRRLSFEKIRVFNFAWDHF